MDIRMEANNSQPPGRPSGPRLNHKKSRSGCATCKRRRVKCDERRPACTSCSRHGVPCVYPTLGPGTIGRRSSSPRPSSSNCASAVRSPSLESPSHLQPQQTRQTHHGGPSPPSGSPSIVGATHPHTPDSQTGPTETGPYTANPTPFYYPPFRPPNSTCPPTPAAAASSSSSSGGPFAPSIPDPPESLDRRLWELRLLHNYIEILHAGRQPSATPPVEFLWTREIPLMAFQDSAVLYAILAQSALNLWTCAASPAEREDMRTLQTTYLMLALREQRASIANLTRATADRVCMASLTILHHSYALVQTTLEDDNGAWQPPLEWLRVGRGTGKVWTIAQGLMTARPSQGDDPARAAKIYAFLNSRPVFDMDAIFSEENREPYLWLLDDPEPRDEDDTELENQVTRWVYHKALSYIGWTARAVEAGEAEFAVQRRLAAFAVWMSDLYEEFCQQRRPRALVVLAWFFRLWIPYGHRWEVNGVGEKMVRAIYGVIEEKWRGKLEPIMREYQL